MLYEIIILLDRYISMYQMYARYVKHKYYAPVYLPCNYAPVYVPIFM